MFLHTLCLKNVPPLVCYNFDTRDLNVLCFFFWQKTLYCATSNNLYFCTTWQNGETRKSHFSLKCCISALPEFNQSLLDFFSLFDSRRMLTLLAVWLPKSCNQCVQLGAVGAAWFWFRRKEVESAAAVGLSYMHNAYAPMRCLPERKKCHLWCVWHLLRLPDIPLILSIDFHFRLDEEQFPSFTQRPTPWKTW